jgi:hypothetical protein
MGGRERKSADGSMWTISLIANRNTEWKSADGGRRSLNLRVETVGASSFRSNGNRLRTSFACVQYRGARFILDQQSRPANSGSNAATTERTTCSNQGWL